MKIAKNTAFKNFLQTISADREVSLLIASDAKGLKAYEKSLAKEGFTGAASAAALMQTLNNSGKHYLVVRQFTKEIYDIIVQFPTGQVELFDSSVMRSFIATPKNTLVIITTHSALNEAEQNGFNIRERTGMAYQA
ncbi:MAG: hypothetical protein A3I29_03920 [Candidatus Magasanikbacteria bacterium RIFCSPLOWO2_02_FULL_44_11]|uniref:Uncharacterized protein n=1 Tax=Candidatus Magasanikbacteria bacterium RIFCSPLOWO2_02_FULL_44_11 TaxID=1798689 RepID=A0A1F6N9G0_9BACT|nr:MAG: hypothetical protein A3I29_03920 [Candidatus Magasanikbacteria bacterium RIFCSPLOWO2_02_FULL_44_11]